MPRAAAYVVTTSPERTIGFAFGEPGTEMPYSVSIPITRRTVMIEGYDSIGGPILPTMRSYRGMPLRTALLTALVDRVRRPPIDEMSRADITAARAGLIPTRPPFSWLTGRVDPTVAITTAEAPARDGHVLPLRVYRPAGAGADAPVILWFHGGGWVLGNVANYDPICADLAAGTGAVVVSVDYRMAPEHVAPTAADDCVDATLWVAAHGEQEGWDESRVAVTGDSAGGNLSAVVAQVLRDRGRSPIRAQGLIYPATDMTMSSPSITEHPNGGILTKRGMEAFRDHYCPPGTDLRDPLVSPLFGRLEGLPPALVQTADLDPIRDDGSRYAAALQAAGVQVELTNYPGVPHGFVSMPGATRQGKAQRRELIAFLRRHLTEPVRPHHQSH